MRALSFRNRISLALLLVGVPSAVAVFGWAYTSLTRNPAKTVEQALRPVLNSGRDLLVAVDTAALDPAALVALRRHRDVLSQQVVLAQRAVEYTRWLTYGTALALAVLGSVLLGVSFLLGVGLTRQLSRPIEELIGWTGRIRRNEPLPDDRPRGGPPEFAALRTALRELSSELQAARRAELERERLRAFREVARRVAHEMKNPLTPIRFAVAALGRSATRDQEEALEVLRAESGRLELLAREFSTLGRLPEGPPAAVDLAELLDELVRTSLPAEVEAHVTAAPGTPHITGHYDPLRRAFANARRNATEAMGGRGRIEVTIRPWEGGVRVAVADQGPGIPREKRDRVFEPYFTEKADGTGLGLSIVKQAVDLHQGRIEVVETPGGGATFVIWLPRAPEGPRTRPADRPFVERRVADRRRHWR
jgi:signal transduction histidine kinase